MNDAVLAQVARLREGLLAQVALERLLTQMTAAYVHLQRILAHRRVRAVIALERPYLGVARLDVLVQLAQRDEAPIAQLAQERQVVDVHVVHVLLELRVLVKRAPTQIAGRLVPQLGAVLSVEHAVFERQPAVIAQLAKLGLEQAAVHALTVVVATAYASEASLAPVALVRADGRLTDAERLLLVVHVALVQRQVVALLEGRIALLAPEHRRALGHDRLGAATVLGLYSLVQVLVQRFLVLERGIALTAPEHERRRPRAGPG